jgi:exosortase A-associated hydrolase 1
MTPQPLPFDCQGERLLGMLHPAAGDLGMVVVVGGPQYRVGSHRHFVHIAESAAAAGHPVLRFDVRGMGDSTGALRAFTDIGDDILAAIDALCRSQPHVQRVALWGLCDGASAALMYLNERRDARVAGVCLLNPWVRSAASLARTHVRHYYLRRMADADFWRKLLRGGIGMGALGELWANLQTARRASAPDAAPPPAAATMQPFQERMRQGWQRFDGGVLLVLSGNDYTAAEFIEHTRDRADWQALLARPSVQRLSLPEADHTLSRQADGAALAQVLLPWLARLAAGRARTSGTADDVASAAASV